MLSADRGRGKSAVLGLASADLLSRDPALAIAVTAPSHATVATLLPMQSARWQRCLSGWPV